MIKNLKSYKIKIPKNVVILYCNEKKIITICGPIRKKTAKLKLEIKLIESKKILLVSNNPTFKLSNNQKKKIKALQGTTTALIKQLIMETSTLMYKKLLFVGVGYRVFDVETFTNKLLLFKLGFSHSIYYRIPKNVKIFCLKRTNLFISGNSYQNVTQTASSIQSYKTPEPYKGKGILKENEKIKIKEGKKLK
jgi:large subunit ribosomal protein L6